MTIVRSSRRLPELEARQMFERLICPLRATARVHGYALAVHGSLARDIDLIAVPWRPDVSTPHEVAEAIRATAADITGHLGVDSQRPDRGSPRLHPQIDQPKRP